MDLKDKIRNIPDFPKKGILFRDITTLLKDADTFQLAIDKLADHCRGLDFDKIAGVESRGFILASVLAYTMHKGFIPMRKPGKLPGETRYAEYQLEYGTDRIEVHSDAITGGEKILLIDDLLATGGTMKAACELVEQLGGTVAECCFLIELSQLNGKRHLTEYNLFSLIVY